MQLDASPAFLLPSLLPSLPSRRGRHLHFLPICTISNSQPQPPSPSRRTLLRLLPLSLLPLFPLPSRSSTRCLPEGAAVSALSDIVWPATWPYTASDFARFDERADDVFYSSPRLVRHIDAGAISALSAYYDALLPSARDVLDVCASLEAYVPAQWPGRRVVAGVGMNEAEMRQNPALSESVVQDLNLSPKLPYPDESFDLVMCNVSIDYLTKPLEVVREIGRVLRKGGRVAVSFSDRVFGTKAVAVWMGGGDQDHVYTVGAYLHYAGGFAKPEVLDLTPKKGGRCTGDPLYVVQATKLFTVSDE